jgi:hypothetical protein
MMQRENGFNEHQSLQLIESMINKAKNQFSENGHLYLLWGWVVFICSVIHFILLHIFHFQMAFLVWMFTWVVLIYQAIYISRRKKKLKVTTYTHDILRYVWLTFIITMFLTGFIISRGEVENGYRLLNILFLALYGIPTFLSGVIIRLKALTIGGICCWILCVIATFVPYDYQLLLISAAMVVAWIIPGYLLQAKYKKAN